MAPYEFEILGVIVPDTVESLCNFLLLALTEAKYVNKNNVIVRDDFDAMMQYRTSRRIHKMVLKTL